MKKHAILLISLFVLTINSGAQFWYNKYYSDRRLSELDSGELSFLYEKSSRTLNTGVVLTAAGTGVTVLCGAIFIVRITNDLVVWDFSGETFYNILAIVTLTGVAGAAAGIPVVIIGAQRKKTIGNTINNQQPNTLLQIIPSVHYNNAVTAYCAGLTVRVSF